MSCDSCWVQNHFHTTCAPPHSGVVGAVFPAEVFELWDNVSGEYLGLRTELHYR